MNMDFKLDKSSCIKCGLCATECPVLIINLNNEYPEITTGKEKACIKCQHCLAVCPTASISIWGKNPEDSIEVTDEIPMPDEMTRLIKTRRSVRRFQKDQLNPEVLRDLLDTASYAPTGHNKNEVLFTFTETRNQTEKVRELVYRTIKEMKERGELKEEVAHFGRYQTLWEEKKVDVLFRNAPHLLIASAPEANLNAGPDCMIALSYFELLANSMGIGTLWDGLLRFVFQNIAPELKTQLGIPVDHKIGYMMVFGRPAVKFARSVQRDSKALNRIQLS